MHDTELDYQLLASEVEAVSDKVDSSSGSSTFVKDLENLSILVAGESGVGKSTLINALFGRIVADARPGSPVQEHVVSHSVEEGKLTLLDTPGFEPEFMQRIISEIESSLREFASSMGFVLFVASPPRVHNHHIKFLKLLDHLDIPIIICLTRYHKDNDQDKKYFEELRNRIRHESITRVSAIVDTQAIDITINIDGKKHTKSAYGKDELLRAGLDVLSENKKKTFLYFQVVNLTLKEPLVKDAIWKASGLALGATASFAAPESIGLPIPIIVPTLVMGIVYRMCGEINDIYNTRGDSSVRIAKLSAATLAWLITQSVPAYVGAILAAELAALIPGAAIAKSVAQVASLPAVVFVIGNLYDAALYRLLKGGETTITNDQLKNALIEEAKLKADWFIQEFERDRRQRVQSNSKSDGWVDKFFVKMRGVWRSDRER